MTRPQAEGSAGCTFEAENAVRGVGGRRDRRSVPGRPTNVAAVTEDQIRALVDRFNQAWNNHDLDAALDLLSDDAVFDATGPPPDGQRAVGRDEIRKAWEPIFSDPASHFDVEDSFVTGDRLVQQWRYSWGDGHIRGVDIIAVADGRVTAKLAYVKG